MFYFGKRIGSLVNRVNLAKIQKTNEPGRLRLSFAIDSLDSYGLVEQTGGAIPKAVVKRGNEYAYFVSYGLSGMTAVEERHVEEAKFAVVNALADAEEEIGMGLFGRAKEIASSELIKSVSMERSDYLSCIVAHDAVGYGPISVLLEDTRVLEEIEINAPRVPISVYHSSYGRCPTNLRFNSEADFRHNINKFIYDADKELGENSPIIDAQVADARVHAQIKPYALSGAAASIRLGGGKTVSPDYLIKKGSTSFEVLAYLWLAMDAHKNIVISGEPASGKTTLMSALFAFVPRAERIVTVEEDINELKIRMDINNAVSLCGSRYGNATTTRDQVINALRMRPDRLMVGEVRGEETRELFSGANLGVPFMTTMHSNSGGIDVVKKLMVRPMCVETRSLSMLDLAVYMKHSDISRRLLSGIHEYRWLSRAETEGGGTEIEESDSVEIMDIVANGRLAAEALANSKVIDAYSGTKDVSKKSALKEIDKRAEFLKVLGESCKSTEEILEKIQGYGL